MNSYEAYEHFPFESRFERFKDKKQYFLEGKNAELVFREFIFFHYAFSNRLFPTLKMGEILNFFYDRNSEEKR
jgi:hypothetical protein